MGEFGSRTSCLAASAHAPSSPALSHLIPKRTPPTHHTTPILAAASCGALEQDIDLFGADLPEGTVGGVPTIAACCDICAGRVGCGAYTYSPDYQTCFLKAAIGWERRGSKGLQSGVLTAPEGPTGPTGPTSPPQPTGPTGPETPVSPPPTDPTGPTGPGPADPNAQASQLWGQNGELYSPGGRLGDWSQAGYGGACFG